VLLLASRAPSHPVGLERAANLIAARAGGAVQPTLGDGSRQLLRRALAAVARRGRVSVD
jgi:hypothetical protein